MREQLNASEMNKITFVSVSNGTCRYQVGQDGFNKSDWPAFSENVGQVS